MKKTLFIFLFVSILIILSGCENVSKNENYKQNSKKIDLYSTDFQSYVKILAKVDSCDTTLYTQNYTKENTTFYQLSKNKKESILLVETEKSCGYTGSCGNRVLVIKNEQDIVFQSCAFIDHILDTTTDDIHDFLLFWRSYNTGNRQVKAFWTGEKFEIKMISSNNIPWSILLQLPWKDKATYRDKNFDVHALSSLEMQNITIGVNGEKATLITGDDYLFADYGSEYYRTYWLFNTKNNEEYELLNTFYEVRELKLTQNITNEYYNLWISKYLGKSPSYYFEETEYLWKDSLYVSSM
ncbi:MAG: hypothetical protein ACPG5B_01855 [Chitinophagales bacterium]